MHPPRHPSAVIVILAGLLACASFDSAEAQDQRMPLAPGSGVSFGQVDWPGLPEPVMDSGTGVIKLDLAKIRDKTGSGSGYINAKSGGSWFVQNTPVFQEDEYPYDEIFTYFFFPNFEGGTDVVSMQVSVTFSPDIITAEEDLLDREFNYPVTPEPIIIGGLPEPIVTPPPDPADASIPPAVLDHASAQVIQRGHPNVNAARNQCMPMAIANSLQFLENTTDLDLPQPHTPGLAPNGNSDGSLVGDVEAETSRASSVTSRVNQGAKGTWGLNGKLKFLARNGLQDDIRTRHFGGIPFSPQGDFTTPDITETAGGNTARSQPFGKTVSIADMINSLRDGEDCEVVYTYPMGGSHAVELVAAGISGGLPWTVTASDLRQTHQGDPGDQNLGAGQGFEFSLMSDKDGDGFLEFPDGRELVTAYCQKYVGTPPQTVTQPSNVTDVDDPAGHSCCVNPPGSELHVTRDGSRITIDGPGDGFPLEGWVEENGEFFASSLSPVAGFPSVLSTISGQFSMNGSAQGVELTIGVLGELFGTPITYTLDIGAAAGKALWSAQKLSANSSGGLLRVNEGETLTVPAGNTYIVNGLLYNEGTVIVSSNSVLRNNGLIDNRGTIQVNGRLEGQGILQIRGTVTNSGVIQQNGQVEVQDGGRVVNNGTWTVEADSRMANGGILDNRGSLPLHGRIGNRGEIRGSGNISISTNGQLDNHGNFQGRVTNNGRLVNVCGAALGGQRSGTPAEQLCRLFARPSGHQVAPFVDTSNLGEADFTLDVDARVLEFSISLPGLDLDGSRTGRPADDVVAIEIRRGTYFEDGSVAFTILGTDADDDLILDVEGGRLVGRWDRNDGNPLSAPLVDRLRDGSLYLMVRTKAHRDGELRGQILPTAATGENEGLAKADLGMLFDRSRDGHGMDFQRAGDNYFLTFFSYGDDGMPEWFLAIGQVVANLFTGELFRFTYDGTDSPPQTGTSVGTAEIEFGLSGGAAACNDGTNRSNALSLARFSWEIDGDNGDWCVEPLIVGGAPPTPNFTGHWFAGSADEGWGLTIYQQGEVLFVVLYFYDGSGKPRWLLGSTQSFSNGDTLTMEQFTGYCRGCQASLQTTPAGTLTLTFDTPSQTPDGNRTTINVIYQGAEGGDWVRNNVPIQLLSDPAP